MIKDAMFSKLKVISMYPLASEVKKLDSDVVPRQVIQAGCKAYNCYTL